MVVQVPIKTVFRKKKEIFTCYIIYVYIQIWEHNRKIMIIKYWNRRRCCRRNYKFFINFQEITCLVLNNKDMRFSVGK